MREAWPMLMPVWAANSRSDHPRASRSFFICLPKCVAGFPGVVYGHADNVATGKLGYR
jgi:hypothetical protein